MGVLQRFERRLGGLVEGAFARVFKGAVEPVEVASALRREAADHKRVLGAGRVLVPNRYIVELSPGDYENFASYGPRLRDELATMVKESIDEQGWTTFGAIEIDLEQIDDLDTGIFRVTSAVDSAPAAPAQQPPASPPAGGPTSAPADDRTIVHPAAQPAARARLVDAAGDQQYTLRPGSSVLGRSESADIRLPDVGISRRHARVRCDGTRVFVTDLGSTNGTLVNGKRADGEEELRDGDRLQVGSTVLVVRMDH